MKGLLGIAFVLFLVWVFAGLVFKVAGGAIHLLLIAAVVLAIISLFQRARTPRTPTRTV